MESKFTHFLITRYNVRLDEWETDRHGQPTLEDDWMVHRYELFSKYCFPSVIKQSENKFYWLIYFESSTSSKHLNQITSLVSAYPYIKIRMVKGYFGCMKDIDSELAHTQTEYVITSRLDNDDSIGLDYIRTIQSRFIPRDKTLINLLHGYSYIPEKHIVTRLYRIQTNSFCSFIELRQPNGGHISVRGFPHGNPPPGTEIINVDTNHSWLRIFHNRNFKSKPFGYPVFIDHFSRHYGINKKYLDMNLFSTAGYSLAWMWDGICRKVIKVFSSEKGDA